MTEINKPKATPRPARSPKAKAAPAKAAPAKAAPAKAAPEKSAPAEPEKSAPAEPEKLAPAPGHASKSPLPDMPATAPLTQEMPVQAPPAHPDNFPARDEQEPEMGAAGSEPTGLDDGISVVTVTDAQERSTADSLSAFTALSMPRTELAGMPAATAGSVEPDGGHQIAEAAPVPVASDISNDPVSSDAQNSDAQNFGGENVTEGNQATGERVDGPLISERRERAEGPEPAAALTADRLLNKAAAPPVGGWRLWLYNATLGYVNVGDSDSVRIQRAMEHRIATRLGERTRYVPVLSRKGGVGKTTVTTLLGMVLAELREDRVIALDANPDRGTLSDRSPGRADFTARQLVKDRFTVDSFAQLSNYTARDGSRLDILASDADPMVAHAFDDADYRAVTDILGRYYSIVLTDSGTGMVHSVMKGTLEKADAVVLVSGGSVDEARLASETLSWLEAHGRQDLVAKATVVINMAAGEGTLVNIDQIEQHFRSRVKHVVRIPHDRHLAEGSRIELRQLRPSTRAAAVELAAIVVEELQRD